MFILNSEITIGDFRFTAVHEVVIKRSVHSIVETAKIIVPAIASIVTNGRASSERVTTAARFKEGDAVTIKLGYNGDLKTEFRGFVKQRKLDMPLEIECEGYSWLIRKNTVKLEGVANNVKSLVNAAVSRLEGGCKISVRCDIDLELTNANLADPCGFDIINHIAKATDGNVVCFFIEPDTLWCGLLYTAQEKGQLHSAGNEASYRTGYNTLKKHTLVPHNTDAAPGIVEYSRRRADGTKFTYETHGSTRNKLRHAVLLNEVAEQVGLKLLADEKIKHNTYSGYEGRVVTFLQPYAAPGYQAFISDSVHPELEGTYLVESTEVRFGMGGARRIIEPGATSKP